MKMKNQKRAINRNEAAVARTSKGARNPFSIQCIQVIFLFIIIAFTNNENFVKNAVEFSAHFPLFEFEPFVFTKGKRRRLSGTIPVEFFIHRLNE